MRSPNVWPAIGERVVLLPFESRHCQPAHCYRLAEVMSTGGPFALLPRCVGLFVDGLPFARSWPVEALADVRTYGIGPGQARARARMERFVAWLDAQGIISTSVPSRFPLREAGWGICEVRAAHARHSITIPKRTDCAVCYEQRIGEWFELWRDHPEQWAQGEAWEASTGRTFRTPHATIPNRSGRDTWPASMRDMAARFAVEPPRLGLKLLERDRSGKDKCRVCSL